MTKFRSTIEAAIGAAWYIGVVVVVPVAVLLVLGIWYLWQQSMLIDALLLWLLIVMCGYALIFGWRKLYQARHAKLQAPTAEAQEPALPEQLSPRGDWSTRDIEVWNQLCQQIETHLGEEIRWQQMQTLALSTLAQTADAYHLDTEDKTWRFSLPEALLVIEETSRRYRQLISEYLPFSEKITVASLLSLYGKQDDILRGLTWANRLRRTLRLVNPLGALLGELRDLVTDRVFAEVSSNLQQSLQRLLLQEVAQVAIDLYSGKLKVGAEELANYRSQANQLSHNQLAEPAEPLRILTFGQISAGKSSLVNALQSQTVAEADVLPVTDRDTVHELNLPGMYPLHLVETPGYRVVDASSADLIATLLTADIWILITQLNRPARQADAQLLKRLHEAIQRQPKRRIPPLLVVLSHADEISSSSTDDRPTLEHISTSTLAQLQLPLTTPIFACDLTQPSSTYGIQELVSKLKALEQEAVQVQFNRRRLELDNQKTGWRSRLTQAGRLGSAIGGKLASRIKSKKPPSV